MSLVNHTSISQTALPKKPVSRMYASLYNSNHIKEKGGNFQNRDDYDKVYKEFMKSKRGDNPKELLQSQRNCQIIQNAILHSNTKTMVKGEHIKSDSKRK